MCIDPLVLVQNLFTFKITTDRDQTVSRRFKPSSRTTLIGEQPNPWNLIPLQDVMSRHRGAKQLRQYELSRVISLLSLAYLLFVERYLVHLKISGHYGRHLKVSVKHVCFSVKRVFTITLYKFITISQNSLLRASVTLWEATAPVKLPLIQKLSLLK